MPLTEYFDSQAQAASALGESLDTLREAKRQGCPAFRSGRVYRKELIGWLATHRQASGLADDPTRLRHRRLKVDTERAEWEFERQRDRHLPVSQFEKALAAMLTAFNTGLSNFAGRVKSPRQRSARTGREKRRQRNDAAKAPPQRRVRRKLAVPASRGAKLLCNGSARNFKCDTACRI